MRKNIVKTLCLLIIMILSYCIVSVWFNGVILTRPLISGGDSSIYDGRYLEWSSRNFENNDNNIFISQEEDAWFNLTAKFPIRTIVIETDNLSDNYNMQILYGSEELGNNDNNSKIVLLKNGKNYIYIPEPGYEKIKLVLVESKGTEINIEKIQVFHEQIASANFFIIAILVAVTEILLLLVINKYRLYFWQRGRLVFEKNSSRVFGLNLLAIISAFSVYIFNRHYSSDSFEAMLDISNLASTNFRNGRIIHGILYNFFSKCNFNILEQQLGLQLLLSIVVSYGVTKLTFKYCELIDVSKKWKFIIVDFGLLFIFFSPCFLFGWYYWPETCLGASLSLAVTFWSINAWCVERLSVKQIAISFALLCISVSMYQVYVELYVGFCLTYSLLKYKFKYNKSAMKEYCIVMTCGGVAGILNIICMTWLQLQGFVYRDSRSASFSLEKIQRNIIEIVNAQKNIWLWMDGLLPKHFLQVVVIVIIIFAVVAICANKKTYKLIDYIYLIWNVFTIYGLAFFPNVISGSVWLAPRTYIGFYTFIFLLIVFALVNIDGNRMIIKSYFYFISLIVLVACFKMIQLQSNTIISNRFDENEIRTIERYIDKYEKEYNTKITYINYAYDGSRKYRYREVQYTAYDNNVRGMAYDWCFVGMIKYYINPKLKLAKMSEEMYFDYFKEQQWDYFYPEEQMKFINDELYIVIY